MTQRTYTRLDEVASYFFEHKHTVLQQADPEQAKRFLLLMNECLIDVLSMVCEDLAEREYREKQDATHILVPGQNFSRNLKRNGMEIRPKER